jgi:hypothetical protein
MPQSKEQTTSESVNETPQARSDDSRMTAEIDRMRTAHDSGNESAADDARRNIALLQAHGVDAPVDAADVPSPPRGFYTQSGTYIVGERSIFASSQARLITSYELDASGWSADGNGDKIAYEGTVLTWSANGAVPHTTTTQAIGVLAERHNLRYSSQECGMVVGGWLNSGKLTDNAVFGTVTSAAKTDLAAIGVFLSATDI